MSALPFKPETPSRVIDKLDRYREIAAQVQRGLRGKPFAWGDAERRSYVDNAAAMGITLLSLSALERRGYQLKRGAQPVGSAYYGSPLSRYANLYVLECQCIPKPPKPASTAKKAPKQSGGGLPL